MAISFETLRHAFDKARYNIFPKKIEGQALNLSVGSVFANARFIAVENKKERCWDIKMRHFRYDRSSFRTSGHWTLSLTTVKDEKSAQQWLEDHKYDLNDKLCKYMAELGLKNPTETYPKVLHHYNRI